MRTQQDYLDKTFLEELNYKIWSTKGSRFNASTRLFKIGRLSNLCNSALSVYLIAVGLLSVYNIYKVDSFDANIIAYTITCLSILTLVFGQIENAKDFNVKAREFHKCGLELSEIYNELRIFKTLKESPTLQQQEEFAIALSSKYQKILERHENHAAVDYKMFKITKPGYHCLSRWDIFKINVEYFFRYIIGYYLLIVIPIAILFCMIYFQK
jgi:hypothetical protein